MNKERFYYIQEKLRHVNQEHLLRFYDKLSEIEQESLLSEIETIDFSLMNLLYTNVVEKSTSIDEEKEISPIRICRVQDYKHEERREFYKVGLEMLNAGKLAAVLVAGGQGSRLGHDGPKGTLNIGLPSGKSLFQLHCERLLNLSKKVSRFIPWYIMTSPINHISTVEHFEENNYFGYAKEEIHFFTQGVLPMIDEKGKVILEDKHVISMGPNGNGGCFLALKKNNIINDLRKQGVEWVFLYGVDNALAKVADPSFLGFTELSGLQGASKVVKKKSPEEKVGVFSYINKKPSVIEYSELPENLRHLKNNKGELVYSGSNIAAHLFKIDFLEKSINGNLPYHAAFKKALYVDENGNIVRPEKPNAYKFELFMFDIFPMMEDMAVLEVSREEEFAPIKDKEGSDSPATAKEQILKLHRKWLSDIGISGELLLDHQVEISPLTSYEGEELEKGVVEKAILESEKHPMVKLRESIIL